MRRDLLIGLAAGAALMYFFDPSWGRRRRAQLRDTVERTARQLRAVADGADVLVRADESADDAAIDWAPDDAYRGRLAQERDAR